MTSVERQHRSHSARAYNDALEAYLDTLVLSTCPNCGSNDTEIVSKAMGHAFCRACKSHLWEGLMPSKEQWDRITALKRLRELATAFRPHRVVEECDIRRPVGKRRNGRVMTSCAVSWLSG